MFDFFKIVSKPNSKKLRRIRMKSKKYLLLTALMLVVFTIALVGCKPAETPAAEEPAAEAASEEAEA